MQRKISGATKSWSVSRIMLSPGTGRSLAVHIALPSATGNASRRIAASCPCEASRANNFLAGRSLAAIFVLLSPRPSAISENRNAVTVRAARGAPATRSLPFAIWARPVSSLTVSSALTTSE